MPRVWSDLAPQLGGVAHENLPECIFFAGRGRDRGLTAKLLLFVSVLRTSREVKLR
jgi:hypothetical protein